MKYFNQKLAPIIYNDIDLHTAYQKIINYQSIWVVTPNIDHLCKLFEYKELQLIYQQADLILNDSKVFQIITILFFNKIKNVVRGSDLTKYLVKKSQNKNFLIFGNEFDIYKLKKFNSKNKYIFNKATFNKIDITKDLDNIKNTISRQHIDYILLCGGFPYSEKIAFSLRKFKNLKILCVGNSVNFITGQTKRAPELLSNIGLEWLFRAIQEPRLIKRYIKNLYYFILIFKK